MLWVLCGGWPCLQCLPCLSCLQSLLSQCHECCGCAARRFVNRQVKKKMTLEEFKRNNRGTNDKADWPAQYLTDIYASISADAIKMSDATGLGGRATLTGAHWIMAARLCAKGRGNMLPLPTSGPAAVALGTHLDAELFGTIWGPTIAALSVVFDAAADDAVLRHAVAGFQAVARIAATHRLDAVMDHLVASLCKFVAAAPPASGPRAAARFGADIKASVALVTAFGLAHKFGDGMRAGWGNVLDCMLRLNRLDLLPDSLGADAECGDGLPFGLGAIRARAREAGVGRARQATGAGSGLLRGFSSLLLMDGVGEGDDGAAPAGDEKEAAARAARCVEQCRIEEVFADTKFLEAESLLALAHALAAAAGTAAAPAEAGGGGGGGGYRAGSVLDAEGGLLCHELLILVTLRNRDRISLLWPLVQARAQWPAQHLVPPSPPRPCLAAACSVAAAVTPTRSHEQR